MYYESNSNNRFLAITIAFVILAAAVVSIIIKDSLFPSSSAEPAIYTYPPGMIWTNKNRIATIFAGDYLNMAIKVDNSLWVWGSAQTGVVKNQQNNGADKGAYEKLVDDVSTISFPYNASELYNVVALKTDGSLWTWEPIFDNENKLMDYVSIQVMEDVASVSASYGHVLVVKNDGCLWAWGNNRYGELGNGKGGDANGITYIGDPILPVKIMDNVAAASAGKEYSMAIKKDGSLWAWGRNDDAQLGDGTTEDRFLPVKIMDNVISIATAARFAMAIKSDNSLWVWGFHGEGHLGDGSLDSQPIPVMIMDNVAAITIGSNYPIALKADGSLWAWGWGVHLIGDNSYYIGDTAIPVKVLEDVAYASVGMHHSAAVKSDGSLWMWGVNGHGQLGDGTTEDRFLPVKIMDNVNSVSVGFWHTVAVIADGSIWTWGYNEYHELGDGTTIDRHSPVRILDAG